MNTTLKHLGMWAVAVGAILLLPFLTRAPWTMMDYTFAGGVLFGAATVFELLTQNVKQKSHRYFVGVVVAAVVFAIWAWAVN